MTMTALLILLPLVLGLAGLGVLIHHATKAPNGCEDPFDGFIRCADCALWCDGVCQKGKHENHR